MNKAEYIIDKDYCIGIIDERIYGSFIEHMTRVVYSGLYEPTHKLADSQGFREDVIKLVKELNISVIRYPGGNFVSGYNWLDGIGPIDKRKKRLELAWQNIETNEIGFDEFSKWLKKVESDIIGTVNLGTGTIEDAGYMLEYCNHNSGTYYSDLRIKNGREKPYKVNTWCLGNEMDGEWQIGHLSSEDYGKKAKEAAKIMKLVDPSIELIACGSSNSFMNSYPKWDRIVLEYLYDYVEYISIHRYYEFKGNILDYIYSFIDMDKFIKTISATIEHVKAEKRSKKDIFISFDEYNVINPRLNKNKIKPDIWEKAKGESNFGMIDCLAFGGLLCTLINNSNKVKIACQSLLINEGGMISTKENGKAIKQATYYPFLHVSKYARGEALDYRIKSPKQKTEKYGIVPLIHSACVYDEENGYINIFCLNYDLKNDLSVEFDFRKFGIYNLIEHIEMKEENLFKYNTYENPNNVVPRTKKIIKGGKEVILSKQSWNVLRFKIK